MTVAIRTACADDLDAITAIYADAVVHGTASYELEPPTRQEMESRFAALESGRFPFLVAGLDGAVVGYAYAGPFRPRPAYRFTVESSVYVAPPAKGKGVGLALLRALVRKAETLGFRQMVAVIGDGSPQSPSVRLHLRAGFRHCGQLRGSGYKHGRWLDTIFMQLAMNGGSSSPPDADSLPERQFRRSARR